jgi:tetratricopeptide (TPR) repeat protein
MDKAFRGGVVVIACLLHISPYVTAAGPQEDFRALRRMIGKERFNDAIVRCERLIEAYPGYFYFYESLPEVGQYARNLDEVASFFEKRIERGDSIGLAYYGLGMVYYYRKNFQNALILFNKAIELGVVDPEVYKAFEYSYEKFEGVDGSIRFFTSMCHRDPENANSWYSLALAFWAKQDYPAVLQHLDEALARKPLEPKFLEAKVAAVHSMGIGEMPKGTMDRYLELARDRMDIKSVLFLMSHMALLQIQVSNWRDAEGQLDEMVKFAVEYGSYSWLASGYNILADVELINSRYQLALDHGKRAVEAADRASEIDVLLGAFSRIFEAQMEQGTVRVALETATQEWNLCRRSGGGKELVISLIHLAEAYHALNANDLALDFALEALKYVHASPAPIQLLFRVQTTIGLIHEGLGNLHAAFKSFSQAHSMIPRGWERDNFWFRHMAVSHGNIGSVQLSFGNFDAAQVHFLEELHLSERVQYERETAYAYGNLGRLAARRGNDSTAISYYKRSLQTARRLNAKMTALPALRGMAEVALARLKYEEALVLLTEAVRLAEEVGDATAGTLVDLGALQGISDDRTKCVQILARLNRVEDAFLLLEQSVLRGGISIPGAQLDLLSLPEPEHKQIARLVISIEKAHNLLTANSRPNYRDRVRLISESLSRATCQKYLSTPARVYQGWTPLDKFSRRDTRYLST